MTKRIILCMLGGSFVFGCAVRMTQTIVKPPPPRRHVIDRRDIPEAERGAPVWRDVVRGTDQIQIKQMPSASGVLAIKATFRLTECPLADRLIWWEVTIYSEDGSPPRPISYQNQSVIIPSGKAVPLTFTDGWDLPPGGYHVRLALWEQWPDQAPAMGNGARRGPFRVD